MRGAGDKQKHWKDAGKRRVCRANDDVMFAQTEIALLGWNRTPMQLPQHSTILRQSQPP